MVFDTDKNDNELCIVAYVYGYEYQGWIPIYLFSIFINYPNYHVRIYLDGSLSLSVKKSLSLLHGFSNYEIIEYSYSKENNLSDMENRSLRWFLCDEELKKYKYIYIGDIDIYICKEEEELLKQHQNHMKSINLMYSNACRLRFRDYLKNKVKVNKDHLFRLTGLHFFETDRYLAATEKCRKKTSELLLCNHSKFDILKNVKAYLLKKYVTIDDERTLFFIAVCSGLGIPNGSWEIDENNPKCFRPLHGMHFAVGRQPAAYGEILASDSTRKITKRTEFEKYFRSFIADYNSYEVLRNLFINNHYILKILMETCNFFGYRYSPEKISKMEDIKEF